MDARRRHQRGEARDQLQRGKDLRAVTAAGAGFSGLVDQVLGIQLLQPFQGKGRTGTVAQQPLQSRPVSRLDAYRSVHRQPAAIGPRLHRARVIAIEQTAAHEALQEAPAHLGLHCGDGLSLEPGGLVDDDTPGGRGREHAVEHAAVKMQVGIERRTETVDEGHRPEAGRGTRARTVRPQGLLHRAQEQAQRRALQVGVAVQEVTQSLRHRQHP